MANSSRAPLSWGSSPLPTLTPAESAERYESTKTYGNQSSGIVHGYRGDERYSGVPNSRAHIKNPKPDIEPVGSPLPSLLPTGLSTVYKVQSPHRRQLTSFWVSGDSEHGKHTQLHPEEQDVPLYSGMGLDQKPKSIVGRQFAVQTGQDENNVNQLREQWRRQQDPYGPRKAPEGKWWICPYPRCKGRDGFKGLEAFEAHMMIAHTVSTSRETPQPQQASSPVKVAPHSINDKEDIQAGKSQSSSGSDPEKKALSVATPPPRRGDSAALLQEIQENTYHGARPRTPPSKDEGNDRAQSSTLSRGYSNSSSRSSNHSSGRGRRFHCRVLDCRHKPEGFSKYGYYRNHMTLHHQSFVEDHSDWKEALDAPQDQDHYHPQPAYLSSKLQPPPISNPSLTGTELFGSRPSRLKISYDRSTSSQTLTVFLNPNNTLIVYHRLH